MTSEKRQQLYDQINALREKNDVLILAHLYEDLDVQHIADFCGDSFELAKKAKASSRKNIVFCGVKFMAESAKILCPDKHVFLPRKDAGCAMADMVTADDMKRLRAEYPNAGFVCYINSGAETKAYCDMCVTSSNALNIVRNMPQKEIVFVPDKNLGAYIAENVPEKVFHIHNGYCPVHQHVTADMVKKARAAHPDALFLVHPECEAAVLENADFVGSTSAMIRYAKESDEKAFIIGTERAVCEKLTEECPDKEFFLLAETLVCEDMKKTTLEDVYRTVSELSDEVILDEEIARAAGNCLNRMMEAGKK